jgi:subtilisin family serine protease
VSRRLQPRHSLAALAGALATATLAAAPAGAATDAVSGQLVAGFKDGVPASAQKQLIERAGGRVVRRLANINGSVVRVRTHGLALSLLRRRLGDARQVRYAEPDYYLHQSTEPPNDPDYVEQYALAPEYPAAFTNSNIVTVAAVTATGALASFSNFGVKSVDPGAPGDQILSTYLGSKYKVLSGTSMASPIVAAAAAMLRSQDPDLTYKDLRSAILSHARPDAVLNGKVAHAGVLDVGAALAAVR